MPAVELAQRIRGAVGIDPVLQLDQPQVDSRQLAIGEETDKILSADEDYTEAHEAGAKTVISADFHLIAGDVDHAAGRQRAEHRPRRAIHEAGVGLIEDSKLAID